MTKWSHKQVQIRSSEKGIQGSFNLLKYKGRSNFDDAELFLVESGFAFDDDFFSQFFF
jgi:hypothetical protein